MRILLGLVVFIAIAGGILAHNRREKPLAPSPVATATPVQSPATQSASQHNWPKRALDRATDVKEQVAELRKAQAAEEK